MRQVMDFGSHNDIRRMLDDIPRGVWHLALTEARPGQISRGSKKLWSLCLGLMQPGEQLQGWPGDAQFRDIRPLAGATREHLYARHARRQGQRQLRRAGDLFGSQPKD